MKHKKLIALCLVLLALSAVVGFSAYEDISQPTRPADAAERR